MREIIVTIVIPLIITIIFGFLEIYGKKYLTPIVSIGTGVIIFFVALLYLAIFLEGREKRWGENKRIHNLLNDKINKLEINDEKILESLKTNEKINILENRISYLEGKGRIKK